MARKGGIESLLYHQTYRDRHGQQKETKTWYVLIKGKHHPLGPDLKEAARRATELLADSGRGVDVGGAHTMRLAALLKLVEDDYTNNHLSSLAYLKIRAKRLRDFFGDHARVADLTADRLREYQAARKTAGAANGTINLECAALQRGFSLARQYGRLSIAPKFTYLKVSNARKGFFERAEFEAVAAGMPGYLKAFVWTAYLTGWRPKKEILTRRWSHVDWGPARWRCACGVLRDAGSCVTCSGYRPGWLRLEEGETKNREGRETPLTPELRRVLEDQRLACDEAERAIGRIIPWVFFWPDDGRRVTCYHSQWDEARQSAGMPQKLLYDCRRTRVRNMEAAGVPRSDGMKMVGHQTEAMYRRYAISDRASLLRSAGLAHQFEETLHGQTPNVVPIAAGIAKKA